MLETSEHASNYNYFHFLANSFWFWWRKKNWSTNRFVISKGSTNHVKAFTFQYICIFEKHNNNINIRKRNIKHKKKKTHTYSVHSNQNNEERLENPIKWIIIALKSCNKGFDESQTTTTHTNTEQPSTEMRENTNHFIFRTSFPLSGCATRLSLPYILGLFKKKVFGIFALRSTLIISVRENEFEIKNLWKKYWKPLSQDFSKCSLP